MQLPELPENLLNLAKLREILANLFNALSNVFAPDNNGNLNMSGHSIVNLADPSNPTDAANKEYVDGLDANNIKKNGSVAFTGDESMGGHKLTHLATPAVGTDAANKTYVDDVAASGGLQIKSIVKTNGISTLNPVDGTTITFTMLAASPSSSAPAFFTCSGYTSGTASVPSNTLGINIDGITYTLAAVAMIIGAGGDRAFDFALSGSIAPILDSGTHTAYLVIGQSGLGFNASPTSPLTLTVIYPA